MQPAPQAKATSPEAQVVTKAVLRAADHLGVSNAALARILGLSDATVSRMRNHTYQLSPSDKAFELGVLFIRLYRSLDSITGGEAEVARAWLRNRNTVLDGRPLDQIQTIIGLTHAIQYLDSRRAVV